MNGTLAQGTITAPDTGNLCGWADLAAVLAAMDSSATYVNVHTNDGVAPQHRPRRLRQRSGQVR